MLSETKSVKSNLHKPTINKVPPSSGIFYAPPWLMERRKVGKEVHFPTKQTGPILFASVRAKRMGDRLAHPLRFYPHQHNYKIFRPLLLRGPPSEFSSVHKPCSLPWLVGHLLGLVVCFRSDDCVPKPKHTHHTKEPPLSLP